MPAWQQQPQCLYGLVGTACWLRLRGLRTLLSLEVEFETTFLHLQNLHWFITNRDEVNVCLKLAFSLRKSRTPIHFIAIVTIIERATQVFLWKFRLILEMLFLVPFVYFDFFIGPAYGHVSFRRCPLSLLVVFSVLSKQKQTRPQQDYLKSAKKLLKSQSLICYVKCS